METLIREPTLCKLRIFQGQISYPYSAAWIVYPKNPCKSEDSVNCFVTSFTFTVKGLLAPRPTPKQEDQLLSFVRGSVLNVFTTTLHGCRPSLHLQPEEAPCSNEKGTLLVHSLISEIQEQFSVPIGVDVEFV
jgi:hypothetical protein